MRVIRWSTIYFALLILLGLILAPSQGLALDGTPDPNRTPPGDSGASYTFYRDVKPILKANCIGCHMEGGIGHNKFPFDAETVDLEQAKGIAYVTGIRYMPPWMPGPDSLPLLNERKLTQHEIDVIQEWYKSGAPLGDPADYSPPPTRTPLQIRADLTLTMPDPYLPDSTLPDDYRCFLIDPKLTRDTFVTGYTIEPGDTRVVHHVIVFQAEAALRDNLRQLEAEDELPGWRCFGGPGLNNEAQLIGLGPGNTVVGAWAPGSPPIIHPEGTGTPLRAGSLIVMQIHYNLGRGARLDQSSIVLQLAEPNSKIQPLQARRLFAPVEIPCPAGMTKPECNRDTAMLQAVQRGSGRAALLAAILLQRCGKSPSDYTGQKANNIVSSCDLTFRDNALAVEIFPHMHTRGKSVRIEVNPGTPEAKVLIDISDWDFHWQGFYQFKEPFPLKAGDIVRITCTWDNTRDNPHYIIWGEGTEEEMCVSGLITMPAKAK